MARVRSTEGALWVEVGAMVPATHRDLRQSVSRSLGGCLPKLRPTVCLHTVAAVHCFNGHLLSWWWWRARGLSCQTLHVALNLVL
eukprot:Skav225082  [mRNA]  locus=scaffold1341:13067:16947:+ [translate_table: standard]